MKTLLSILMLMAGMVFPQAWAGEKLPLIQNVNAYETMSLNGEWNYIVDLRLPHETHAMGILPECQAATS